MKRDLTLYYLDEKQKAEVIRRLGDLVIKTKEAPAREGKRSLLYIQLKELKDDVK